MRENVELCSDDDYYCCWWCWQAQSDFWLFFFNETAFHCSTTTTTLTWILCKIISLQINFISSNSFSIFLSTPFLFYLLKALIFSTELNLSLHLNDEFWIYSLSHYDNFMNDNFEVVFNDDDDVKNYLHQNLLHISKCCCC